MTLEEKDKYIEEHLMALEPDTLRYLAADFYAALQDSATLRDQFAMSALTGNMSISDDRTYRPDREDCIGLSLEEWQAKLYLADAKYIYRMADAMMEARKQ